MDPFVLTRADGLTVQGSRVYWKAGCGDDFSPPTSEIASSPVTGVAEVLEHYHPSTCQPDRVASASVAVDHTSIYWLTGDGRVVALPAASGGVPQTITTMAAPPGAGWPSHYGIVVTAANVYWNEGTTIYAAPLLGGARQTLVSVSGTAILALAILDPDHLVFTDDRGQLTVVAMTGDETPHVLASNVSCFTVGDGQLVWAATSRDSPLVFVSVQPVGGGDVTTVYHSDGRLDGHDGPVIESIAADASGIFIHQLENVTGGPIIRITPSSGDATAISDYLPGNLWLAVSEGYLFWTDFNTGIFRLETGAPLALLPGQVTITGVEVTQGVQTADGRIPLLAERRTYFRVYVRAEDDGLGAWAGVTARLQVSGGLRPHTPIQSYSITVPTTGSSRATLDNSFLFELDPEETTAGTHSYLVQLFLPAGRPTLTPDPRMSGTLGFLAGADGNPIGVEFYGVRYRYVNVPVDQQAANGLTGSTWPERPWSALEDDARLASAFLPVAYLALLQWPGNPVLDVDFEAGYTVGRDWAHQLLDLRGPGDPVQRVAVLQPEITTMWQGACSQLSPPCYINWHQQTPDDPGTTLAHELGHSLGLAHTENVGAAYGAIESAYPRYPSGDYGPEVGLAPVSSTYGATIDMPLSTVPGTNPDGTSAIADLMAYNNRSSPHPTEWLSPYCYCKAMAGASQRHVNPSDIDGYSG